MSRISKRVKMALEYVPELFDLSGASMSILYIGAHHKEIALVPQLKAAGHRITLLEIVPNFAKRFMSGGMSEGIFNRVFVGDVRCIDDLEMPRYDAIIWWHGPEHIEHCQFEWTVRALEAKTKQLILMACPWGDSKMYGTDVGCTEKLSMRHLSKLYPIDFSVFGYNVRTMGKSDGSRQSTSSHILAWKWLDS